MPRQTQFCAPHRLSVLGLLVAALALATAADGQILPKSATVKKTPADKAANPSDKNIVLSADRVTRDDVNNTVSATGHVELVQGATMLLAERVIWNQNTDIVTATGDVKLVNDEGDIYFGDYLEITDDMRQGFMDNVSNLLADNSRMVAKKAEKNGNTTVLHRGVYSPCELCAEDPTKPPTWQIKAVKVIHDSDEKRIYYHDATFQIDGIPVAWTPYFSTYDPTVKRASGFLETLPGYRSQLGSFVRSRYYFDIAPDIDAVLEGGYFSQQGPLIGGEYRERFGAGQIEISGSIAQSDIRQYPTPQNQDEKTLRGHIFAVGEFDLDENWRTGFQYGRSLDSIYVLKYQYSSLQVLPQHAYLEGFFDRNYVNVSAYSFQDLRPGIPQVQPHALPYVTFSFFGDPGETFGGRWADSGSLLTLQRYPGTSIELLTSVIPGTNITNTVVGRFPGQSLERIANNASWNRKLFSDTGLVTTLNASLETDYYWTHDIQPDPVTGNVTARSSVGRIFPQAYAVMSYPLARPVGYAQLVIEPIVSAVVSPARTNNQSIPNEDSQDLQLDPTNLFTGNSYPGIDRVEDGSRVTYGIRTGLYNLGTGFTSLFLGQNYRITGSNLFPANSGLQTRFSDFVGEIEVSPGKLVDFGYHFEMSNDFKSNRLSEANFRVGPDNFAVYGSYVLAGKVDLPNIKVGERNELSLGAYYKFDEHWSVNANSTTELTHPRKLLRYGVSGGYNDDCSTFTLNIAHSESLFVSGTSGTSVFLQFSLKNLGIFRSPNVH